MPLNLLGAPPIRLKMLGMALPDGLFAEGYPASTQQLLLLAAVILVGFLFMRMLRRATPSEGSARQYRREIDTATSHGANIKGDMEHLLIELDKLSREISAQVDTKFARLEGVITEADRRIAALRILLDAAKAAGASLGIEETAGQDAPGPVAESASVDSNATADAKKTDATTAQHEEIFALADQGMLPLEIARKLDRRVGEIELILNLRQATGGQGWPRGIDVPGHIRTG
jgi:hypothetical protein